MRRRARCRVKRARPVEDRRVRVRASPGSEIVDPGGGSFRRTGCRRTTGLGQRRSWRSRPSTDCVAVLLSAPSESSTRIRTVGSVAVDGPSGKRHWNVPPLLVGTNEPIRMPPVPQSGKPARAMNVSSPGSETETVKVFVSPSLADATSGAMKLTVGATLLTVTDCLAAPLDRPSVVRHADLNVLRCRRHVAVQELALERAARRSRRELTEPATRTRSALVPHFG